MKFQRILFLFFVFIVSDISAQDKVFTITEAVRGGYTTFYPKGIDQFQWVPGGKMFSQMTGEKEERKLHILEIEKTTNGLSKYVTLSDINEAIGKLKSNDKSELKAFPSITWMDQNSFRFTNQGEMLAYHVGDKTAKVLGPLDVTKMEFAEINPVNYEVAYIQNDNLHIASGKETITITEDGGKGIVYGQSVHRNEFGIDKGLFWSPKGNILAFYRMDESMVTEYPLYKLTDRPATGNLIRYPIAGAKSHHVTIGVFNPATKKTIYLHTGEPKEQYLTNVTWSPDETVIYVAIVNRGQNHMWLNAYDPNTGNLIKTLFEEKNERYVEPEHGPIFLNNQSDRFLWYSERDGFNHLYLYKKDGELVKQVTKGNWVVTDYLGCDVKAEKIFVVTTEETPLERHLYCVNMKNGKSLKLSNEAGVHSYKANSNMTYFFDDFNNATTPRKTQIINALGTPFQILSESANTLKEYKLAETTTGTLKSEGGVDLYYRLYKPVDFDPSKKYPVIVYLYNGPHLQLVTNNWQGGLNLWYHYMAQKGYAVFIIDGRGSLNRGFDFESAVHRQLGTLEMQDQLTGVRWLKSQSWVDSTRLGIHGWSFGGFMTTTMMTRAPGTFKVGVAGGPVIDWGLYEIMYTERYMDTPEENPEGFKNANLLNYVDSLQGKLIIIHGAQDDVVLWQHSLLYLEQAIKKGKQLDYFVYPHHPHNVGGKDRVHLMEKISNYFFDNL